MITAHCHPVSGKIPAASVRECCAALEVSHSGYYAHRHKGGRPRRQQDAALSEHIAAAFAAGRSTYGSRRVRHQLRREGRCHSRRRVARLMRRQGLQARCKGRFRPRTTDSRHGGPLAPHLLLGAAPPTRPN